MRLNKLLILVVLVALGCGKPATSHDDHPGDSTDTNRALYDEVMDIHDQVMPKMSDIYALKKQLQDQIAASPQLVDEERKKLEKRISNLDSVGQLMMAWMHDFSPLPDSADQESAREYLESEMEKIKKVRDAMLEAIEAEKKPN